MAKQAGPAYIGDMRADPIVVQRWRDLRQMLIRQLDMFDNGNISLKTNNVDVSAEAIGTSSARPRLSTRCNR